MKVVFIVIVAVTVMIIALNLTACKKRKDNKKTGEIRTDIQGISWLLKPHYQPKAVWYMITRLGTPDTTRAPGPNDYVYSAVLLFDKKDVDSLLKQASLEQSDNLSANDIFADVPELHTLLKEHGALEAKVYDASNLLINGGSMVRIKGTNKLFISYITR